MRDGSDAVFQCLHIDRNHKISSDTAQDAIFLHHYNAGNIGSFILKTFTMQPM